VTHFRTSVTAVETDLPHMSATQLIARPGTFPTVTIPMIGGRLPDVDAVWQHLREPAEFFGIPMPDPIALARALARLPGTASMAVTITIVEGRERILVSATDVQPSRTDAVLVAADESVPQAHRATDPWWRRMAARTTSRGELDQRERWLNGRGYADGLAGGVPLLGALVFETAGGVVGVENPEPTSVLDQLARCGAISEVVLASACPTVAHRVWWVSPRFETHPVAELDGTRFAVDPGAVPSFARWA
jgi:hypothetical protein